jgi:uncharacterized protein YecE (DUF72 family)
VIGDGSPGGWRTRKTGFPERLVAAGFGEWNDLAKLHKVRNLLAGVLGAERVLVGCEGFNAVDGDRPSLVWSNVHNLGLLNRRDVTIIGPSPVRGSHRDCSEAATTCNRFSTSPASIGGLNLIKDERRMDLYVGTSGYSYKPWKGTFYPKDLPVQQMLRFYGERFRTVEINSTFRGMPKVSVLEGWAEAVPADFQFVLKAPQQITHVRKLNNAGDLVSHLLEVAGALTKHLGPLLFQLPPTSKKDVPRLRAFLALLPSQSRVAFEFRHPSWFDDEVFGLLRDHRAALCVADADGELEVPFVATADWGYLRLRRPDYGDAELEGWVKRVREQDWSDAFVFFKHEDEGKGPRFAKRYLELAASV